MLSMGLPSTASQAATNTEVLQQNRWFQYARASCRSIYITRGKPFSSEIQPFSATHCEQITLTSSSVWTLPMSPAQA